MRSWESEPRRTFAGGRADFQDRMDRKEVCYEEVKERLAASAVWVLRRCDGVIVGEFASMRRCDLMLLAPNDLQQGGLLFGRKRVVDEFLSASSGRADANAFFRLDPAVLCDHAVPELAACMTRPRRRDQHASGGRCRH